MLVCIGLDRDAIGQLLSERSEHRPSNPIGTPPNTPGLNGSNATTQGHLNKVLVAE
jgi:hypothetical protein